MKFLVYAFLILYSGYSFSTENIRLVIASGAGGIVHRYALKIAPVIAKEMNAKVIVELKPGAEGYLAASYVKKQENDLALLIGTPQSWRNIPNANLSHVRDFRLVSFLGSAPGVLVSSSNSKHKTLHEFMKASFTHKVTYGISITNQIRPLMNELIEKYGNKENFIEVTYKSGSEAVNAVMGNHIDFAISVPETVMEFERSEKLIIIGVLSLERHADLPADKLLSQQNLRVNNEFKHLANVFLWTNTTANEEDYQKIKRAITNYLSSKDFDETKKTMYLSLPKDFDKNSEKYLRQILE